MAAASQAHAEPAASNNPAAAAELPTSILVVTLAALVVVAILAWRNTTRLKGGPRAPGR
jgi:hypothetical protein